MLGDERVRGYYEERGKFSICECEFAEGADTIHTLSGEVSGILPLEIHRREIVPQIPQSSARKEVRRKPLLPGRAVGWQSSLRGEQT